MKHAKRSSRGDVHTLSKLHLEATQATLELLDGWKQREVEEKAKDDAIRANIGAAPATLTLNVGGTMFTTSKVASRWPKVGPYFLDLDPRTFDRVLGFLRSEELCLGDLSDWDLHQLDTTLQYLNIPLASSSWPLNVVASDAAEATVIPSTEAICPSMTCLVSSPSKPRNAQPEEVIDLTNPSIYIVEYPQWTWNRDYKSQNLILMNQGRTVKAAGLLNLHSVLGNVPVMAFSLKLEDLSGESFVGFAGKDGFDPKAPNKGYYIGLRNGFLCNVAGYYTKPYCTRGRIQEGDILTARRSEYIRFERNGEDLGVAFTIDPSLCLYPAVSIRNVGSMTVLA
ncbi:hypothetical protein AeMF1_004104 [Aphanomyces euteiches]|nr:hypothetical protein AeMF1_004104 [Aphanomyces euteiches]KAH9187193.1 hypothetical protein AeNC1_010826 [Aphanomyces euteiches]